MMPKAFVISTANELVRLMPQSIAYISSEGNYSVFTLIDRSEKVFSFNLQHCGELMVKQLGSEAKRFVRIGKSLFVNRDYIFQINPSKQRLTLANESLAQRFELSASKEALRQVKQLIESEL